MSRMRPKHRFLLTAWVFLPDHGHAIIDPPYHFPSDESKVAPTSCSSKSAAFSEDEPQSFSKSKLCATSFNQGRREAGEFWQGRFFDCALRTVKEYLETVEYIHMNPLRRGLVKHAEEWKWSVPLPPAANASSRCLAC